MTDRATVQSQCGRSRRHALLCIAAVAAWAATPLDGLAQTRPPAAGQNAAPTPLVLGVVPYLSARRLVELFEPVRAFLQAELGRAVVIETAPDYLVYLQRCADGAYDFVATSPYFARISQQEQQFTPLARPLVDMEPLIVVPQASAVRSLADLAGRTITAADPFATVTLAGRRYLAAQGLRPGHEVTVRAMGSHANSLAALLQGESSAAIITTTGLHQMGGDWAQRVRVLARLPTTPPLIYLGHQRLGAPLLQRVQTRMIAFANDTPAGQAFSQRLAHGGLKPVSDADMRALDPFVLEFRAMQAAAS